MTLALRIVEILNQYHKLIEYCDLFFSRVRRLHQNDFSCAAGCSYCCTLQSVCALEAAVIASWVEQTGFRAATGPSGRKDHCPLLVNNRCQGYHVRPLICRTHGLLLRSDRKIAYSCPLNFSLVSPNEISPNDILDNDRITMNLMKLNLAFAMATGRSHEAQLRFDLYDIIRGQVPPEYILSRYR